MEILFELKTTISFLRNDTHTTTHTCITKRERHKKCSIKCCTSITTQAFYQNMFFLAYFSKFDGLLSKKKFDVYDNVDMR